MGHMRVTSITTGSKLRLCFRSHAVASTETLNKTVGKGKKVNTTKGDKKVQQPEQEVNNRVLLPSSHSSVRCK